MMPTGTDEAYMPAAARPGALQRWLEIATWGLCDAARASVWDEGTDDYAHALSRPLGRGVPRETADAEAAKSLGSPYRAWIRYRREHLSQRQFDLLEKVSRNVRRDFVLLGVPAGLATLVFLLIVVGAAIAQSKNTLEGLGAMLMVLVMFGTFGAIVYAWFRVYRCANLKRRLMLRGVGITAACVVFLAMAWSDYLLEGPPEHSLYSALIVSVLPAFLIWDGVASLHLRRKLHRVNTDALPPGLVQR